MKAVRLCWNLADMFQCRYVLLPLLLLMVQPTRSTWTMFDFVRNVKGKWGSTSDVPYRKIGKSNGPTTITAGSMFGISVANLGDLDGDGVEDLAVGAPGESNTYTNTTNNGKNVTVTVEPRSGAVYILLMSSDGTCKSWNRIGGLSNGGPKLYNGDEFGFSVSALGDLDGDGIPDMAAGAPGVIISSAYILYLNINGTAKSNVLIRGQYSGTALIKFQNGSWPQGAYIPNGPLMRMSDRFGIAMTTIGDWDNDGIPDLAVSRNNVANGLCSVYLLFLYANGTVKDSVELAPGLNGGPEPPGTEIDLSYSSFGTSMLLMPDKDGDGVNELVIGAKQLQDKGTANYHSGVLFYCMMSANGFIKSYTRLSELSSKINNHAGDFSLKKKIDGSQSGNLPMTPDDNCGSGIAQIGDINKDDQRQHYPMLQNAKSSKRPPVVDLIVGCPQTNTQKGTGRLMMYFLSPKSTIEAYRVLPSDSDAGVAPNFNPRAHVGTSLASIQDLDKNGLQEIVAGAPGDDEAGVDSGAIYVFFFRRRRWHLFIPDTRSWLAKIIVPPSIAVFFCCCSIVYFFVRFRRKPDEIELMVRAAGVEIGADANAKVSKKKKHKHKEEGKSAAVYADDF